MNLFERGRQQEYPIFLEQEQRTERNRGTCFPTSVVNATLGFGLVTNKEAVKAHRQINQAMGDALVWSFEGYLLFDYYNEDVIASILEQFLPIKVGRGRGFRRSKSYTDLLVDITQKTRTYVVMDPIDKHSYAAIPYGNRIAFIDPNEPREILGGFDDFGFSRHFHGGELGLVTTAPLTPVLRKSYWYNKFFPFR